MTHINAFFADVDEAAQKVVEANALHRAAMERLEAKKLEVNWHEPAAPEETSEPSTEEPDQPPEEPVHEEKLSRFAKRR